MKKQTEYLSTKLFHLFTFSPLSEANARFICLMTVFAQNRASDFRLERHVVVFAAVVADNIKSRGSVRARRRFFRAAFRTSLRRHHIPLIKNSLFLFRVKKNVFTLQARHFQIWHCCFFSCSGGVFFGEKCITNQ